MDRATRQHIAKILRSSAALLTGDFASLNQPKNKWVELTLDDLRKDPALVDELFDLVRTAYKPIGGHLNLKSPADLLGGEVTIFDAVDIDDDPEADAVGLIREKPAGRKWVAVGQDGSRPAKDAVIQHEAEALKVHGVFTEVSAAMAHIFLTRFNLPIVADEATARKVLKGKDIEWVGEHPEGKYPGAAGWYYRDIAGHRELKIMVGKPRA